MSLPFQRCPRACARRLAPAFALAAAIGCGGTFAPPGSVPAPAATPGPAGSPALSPTGTGAEATGPHFDRSLWTSLSKQARSHLQLGELERAEILYGDALDAVGDLPPYDARRQAAIGNLLRLADRYWALGRREDFARVVERANTAIGPAAGAQLGELPAMLVRLAAVQARQDRPDDAVASLRQAIAIASRTRGVESAEVGDLRHVLGRVMVEAGRLAEAEQELEQALAITEAVAGPEAGPTLETMTDLARLRMRQGRRDEAQALARRVLDGREATAPGSADHASALNELAWIHIESGDIDRGLRLARRAVAIADSAEPRSGPVLAAALDTLGSALVRAGRATEALPVYERAIDEGDRAERSQRLATLAAYQGLLAGLGRSDAALRVEEAREALAAGDLARAATLVPALAPPSRPAKPAGKAEAGPPAAGPPAMATSEPLAPPAPPPAPADEAPTTAEAGPADGDQAGGSEGQSADFERIELDFDALQ